MTTYTATYSPEDNKLRLYASSRLDSDLYTRLRESGFIWAPKQELFVAPMWTPEREDILLELVEEIESEDSSLEERAAERAERFETYNESRLKDYSAARKTIENISEHIPFGQPILVGHHSERHARKDAERIESSMRKAVKAWDTAEYWTRRAEGSLHHAEYKQLPGVRHRRIKGLESDKRKQEKIVQESTDFLLLWNKPNLTHALAVRIAGADRGFYRLYSALSSGKVMFTCAIARAIRGHERTIARAGRWINQLSNRIIYERAMLNAGEKSIDAKTEIKQGGQVLVRGVWSIVLKVTKKADVVTIEIKNRDTPKITISEVSEYQEPSQEQTAAIVAAITKPIICNFPGEGILEITKADWAAKHTDYKSVRLQAATDTHGAYRFRRMMVKSAEGWGSTLTSVYISDQKRVDPPAKTTPPAPDLFKRPAAVAEAAPAPTPAAAVPTSQEGPAKGEIAALRAQLKAGVQVVTAPQLFPTPSDIAAKMVDLADIRAGMRILEPSAGTASILRAISNAVDLDSLDVVAVEINHQLAQAMNIRFPSVSVQHADFMEWEAAEKFDAILLNPPFADLQDIAHITRALSMLKPGGNLVAICANGPRQNDRLRPLVEQRGGTWEPLPADSFKSSGTGVNTVLIHIAG